MLEEKIHKLLVMCFSEFIKEDLKGVYSQIPKDPLYPYLLIDLHDVEPRYLDHQVISRFSVTLISKYKGQKESQRIIGRIRDLFNRKTFEYASFRLETQKPTQLNKDHVTRQTTLQFSCLFDHNYV